MLKIFREIHPELRGQQQWRCGSGAIAGGKLQFKIEDHPTFHQTRRRLVAGWSQEVTTGRRRRRPQASPGKRRKAHWQASQEEAISHRPLAPLHWQPLLLLE